MTSEILPRFAERRAAIHRTSFTPAGATLRVGAEVELLVLDELTRFPIPLVGARRSVLRLVRAYALDHGWREIPGYGAVPKFEIPDRGVVSFEPGGQLELSTIPCATITELVATLHAVVLPFRAALANEGVRLESVGIDPLNDARDIALQLPVERYEAMTRYFERRGPFGVRMMRQTAAIQVWLDRGPLPAERWRLLNDLAPYVIAIFANSPHYRGVGTGHRSYRAHCWRQLDPSRTGVSPASDDPASAYARFAYAANDMSQSIAGPDAPFAATAHAESDRAWETHLSTLFPEVRPRGHFEVRSCDAIPPEWYAAPIVFLAGLAYDERAAREAAILAGDSRALLRAAGEIGLRDTSIARTARDLFQLALAGARRLGPSYCDGSVLDVATTFYETYTARDRSPADDRVLHPRDSATAPIVAPST